MNEVHQPPAYWIKIELRRNEQAEAITAYAAVEGFAPANSTTASRQEQLSSHCRDATEMHVLHPALQRNLARISFTESIRLQGTDLTIRYLDPVRASKYGIDVFRNRPV